MKLRWILAALSLLGSGLLMASALKMGGLGAAFPVILSMAGFLSCVLLIAPETAFKLAEWIAKPFAALFYPTEEFNKPSLSYLLARRYSQERRLEDAVSEYEKILHYYPEERDAYVELLELTERLGDPERHSQYLALFQKRFPTEAAE